MISPEAFYRTLSDLGVNFFVGVPDSLLKEFCKYVEAKVPEDRQLVAANEGTAVGVAAGMQLATSGLPLLYLQNSGLGNLVNPLLSLADPDVYAIPMIVLIGWRGEPGVKDEPQHVKQGRVTTAMLEAMEVPYRVISGDPDEAAAAAAWAADAARSESRPVVLLARKGAFAAAETKRADSEPAELALSREEAVAILARQIPESSAIVSTTGMISRELYEYRVRNTLDRSSDFLTVGSMGHASQIALGLCLGQPGRHVVCLDGDGAAIMHLGGLTSIGQKQPQGLTHVVINNGAHDSVGGQLTAGFGVSLTDFARAANYPVVLGPIYSAAEIEAAFGEAQKFAGPRFIEIRVKRGARADLGRPKESPAENKAMFTSWLGST